MICRGDRDGWRGELSASLVLGFESEYVFRGEKRAGNSLQPGLEVGRPMGSGNGYLGVWSNRDLDGGSGDEVDVYGGYVFSLDPIFRFSAGATWYGYSGNGDDPPDSLEPFVGLSADLPFRPFVSGYFDVEQEQILGEVGIGDRIPFAESLALEWTMVGGAAHAEEKNGTPGAAGGFWFGEVAAGIVWSPGGNLQLSLVANYSGREEGGFADYLTWGLNFETWF